jgi:hypothetical protein
MYYAKVENGQIVKTHINVSDEVPDITFTQEPTAEQLAPYSVVIVNSPDTLPAFDELTQGLIDAAPILGDNGLWYATYTVVDLPPVEPVPEPVPEIPPEV